MDIKMKAAGGDWEQLAWRTSNIPFRAIVQGRNTLEIGELVGPMVVGTVLYLAIFWGHQWVSGVPIFW